ncbi:MULTISPECIES: CocE/NonD family hydrolase [unclassified Mesorhizobium]|uniref:CocE/NonD family hydrolase n=1 Tax=unclassified Mesorhizobium TaxID=325217 RepID=UPI00192697FD|nr:MULTISPECIES: CocE/NonD family hydrolase [unclassified Mesorhizobium]BCG82873.1 peptidase S15 [Mesorhizobium sp. 113-3-3]BCG90750.1 peptidase S15 [Mesorhizobium sp. 113-3-9]
MKIVTDFPRKVREIENVFIPLSDGTQLSARIWLPEDAETDPVPAILEYTPYRKRDWISARDTATYRYYAGHGYAGVRVDLRGTGESDGLLVDEYAKQEQDDCLEVLAWLAKQPWCTGACGMIGISWGGFNGLQVAARNPPELKAVVSLCSTDDRYRDDIHYIGGCLLLRKITWAEEMTSELTYAPDPALLGERWREMWLRRLENLPLLLDNWLEHQRRDAYWKHGSVCEDYSSISCPVYAVSGWTDGYTNAVPRLLSKLSVPRKGLVGPWGHHYPHVPEAFPGPQIGFLQECLRWWDHWLKGKDTGVMDEPMYRAWLCEPVRPKTFYSERPGRWVAEPSWPSPHIQPQHFTLNVGTLSSTQEPEAELQIRSPLHTGAAAGRFSAWAYPGDMPADQREEDGKSLCFDSEPLETRIEILGAPVVELDVSSNKPVAQICIRLNDVAPDGASTRVSYGLLNLTHRDGHEMPTELEPGRRYKIRVQLKESAYAFPPGNRIRVAVSSAYWPFVWPTPEPATVSVFAGASKLELPTRHPRLEDEHLKPFLPPEAGPLEQSTVHREGSTRETTTRDLVTGETTYVLARDNGSKTIDHIGLEIESGKLDTFKIGEDDPLTATIDIENWHRQARDEWEVHTKSHTSFRATETEFIIEARVDAFEGGNLLVSRKWNIKKNRDLI